MEVNEFLRPSGVSQLMINAMSIFKIFFIKIMHRFHDKSDYILINKRLPEFMILKNY